MTSQNAPEGSRKPRKFRAWGDPNEKSICILCDHFLTGLSQKAREQKEAGSGNVGKLSIVFLLVHVVKP